MAPYTWYPQRMGRVDMLVERRRRLGSMTIRQPARKSPKCSHWQNLLNGRLGAPRAASAAGKPQGPEGSIGKLAASIVARAANLAHTTIAGPDAMLTGDDDGTEGVVAEILVSTPAISIAGGTDEIQRNIISERILKMPKEMRTDTDRPFRDVPRNQV